MRERNNLTFEQRQERRKAKAKPAKNYYQLQKYATLRYDYGQIREEHREQVAQAAVEIHRWQRNTIAIGKTLLAVKELLPHGQFEDWWQAEFGLSERMVQSLLTLARVYGDPSNPRRVAGLSDGALYLLAAPSTPEAARLEVEQMLIAGNPPKRAQVKAIIEAHKPKQLTANPRRVAGLIAAVPEVESDTIEAEYTVIQSDADHIQLALTRSMLRKLHVAVVRNQRIWDVFTGEELDRLNIILSNALKGEEANP